MTDLTDEVNSYERNVLLFNGNSDEFFFSIYLRGIYNTYLKEFGEDPNNNLFNRFDNEDQKSQ